MQSSKLPPFTIYYDNSEEYHHLKNEVFTQGSYYFETEVARPRIIDAGAHIGLSTFYFKKLYLGAQIIAIEPNPHSFTLLEKNIFENQLEDVETHQVALSAQPGATSFFYDMSDDKWESTASFLKGAWTGSQQSQEIQVHTQTLDTFITETIDFLKMDIEGAEQEVLFATKEKLQLVRHMIVEFHPIAGNSIEKLSQFLKDLHFELKFWKKGQEIQPKYTKGLFYIEAINCTRF
jgi:FkbM family methyltransferase